MAGESTELRIAILQRDQKEIVEKLGDVESRVTALEDNHSVQDNVLGRLEQTVAHLSSAVHTLHTTVVAMNDMTVQTDKALAVTRARFDIVIAILATIGVAVIGLGVKLLFFPGVAG